MTTEAIKTPVGIIPHPSNWSSDMNEMMTENNSTETVLFLEKATDGRVSMDDIQSALSEYKRLYKA